MVYMSTAADGFYLSLEAMLDLGMLRPNSELYPPVLRNRDKKETSHLEPFSSEKPEVQVCSCPTRSEVPPRPERLPFEAIPENNDLMKKWLLKEFSSSTFNVCPHQKLLTISKPPIQLHVDENAKPKACHTPSTIPLH